MPICWKRSVHLETLNEADQGKTGRARVTAVARSNYKIYTTDGVTVDTDRFGKIENWKPYRG